MGPCHRQLIRKPRRAEHAQQPSENRIADQVYRHNYLEEEALGLGKGPSCACIALRWERRMVLLAANHALPLPHRSNGTWVRTHASCYPGGQQSQQMQLLVQARPRSSCSSA